MLVVVPSVQSLLNIDLQFDVSQKQDYRLAVLLENVQSLDASRQQLENTEGTSGYSYDRRRSIIPVEYFWNEKTGSETGIGYRVRNGHCYLEEVSRLDGERFGFYLKTMEPESEGTGGDFKSISQECRTASNVGKRFYTSALLVREDNKNPPLMVRIFVYEIG
ncbi:MAG: hypothetical protein SVV03_03935 [Candidatus Nanohaloarchaea archaeon]|nr:hypothetical protein [Candidatus Nanohaloarchaea archaeon]